MRSRSPHTSRTGHADVLQAEWVLELGQQPAARAEHAQDGVAVAVVAR